MGCCRTAGVLVVERLDGYRRAGDQSAHHRACAECGWLIEVGLIGLDES